MISPDAVSSGTSLVKESDHIAGAWGRTAPFSGTLVTRVLWADAGEDVNPTKPSANRNVAMHKVVIRREVANEEVNMCPEL